AEESELIRRIESQDEFEVMPPPGHGDPLSRAEIDLLRRWIERGAEYQRHWSFTELTRPSIPKQQRKQPENPIDAFIRRRLAAEQRRLAASADPRTLVRRLSFDLTGLPPDPQLANDFIREPSDEAYARLVEKCLTSPHYGERMAMYWLDLVRYADTLGYHGDQPRSVSPFRDYVVKAFNDNLPFDQFTTEQIAGDLLPNATLWQKVASTYNRLNRASGEGGVQPKEYLAKYSADRVRTTGAVWLGSTIGCAECHDHKFDPFTARDFYRLAAFFADIKEQGIVRSSVHIEKLKVPTPDQARQLEALNRKLEAAQRTFLTETSELVEARKVWEAEIRADVERWRTLMMDSATSEGGAVLKVLDDDSILASGSNPDRDVYLLRGKIDEEARATDVSNGFVALRLELLPDNSLPRSGPGRASNGNLVLHSVDLTINGQAVEWQSAVASHSQANHAPEYVINGQKNGWAILPRIGQPSQLVLMGRLTDRGKASESDTADPQSVEVRLKQNHGTGHNLGRFRLALTNDSSAGQLAMSVPVAVRDLVQIPDQERTDVQREELAEAFRNATPLLEEIRDQLAQLRSEKEQLEKSIVTTRATTSTEPRMIRVLPRGDWMDDSGEEVLPGVPGFLASRQQSESGKRLTRLDLAHWLTSRENPLVARTFVNRLWMLMLGNGLARNVDDLGSQGEPPTHPELLDWLSVEFIESGWNVKHMIELIVHSETYKQSSKASAELMEADPYNRLYGRQSRWRLEAEMVRDNALAVSGLLSRKIGGVSAKPYQPAGYWAQLNFPRRSYKHDRGPNQFRRGLYTHWQRTF
ncbi:MAG: PSD1 and planctomycete cytochrome C domain-containing protein, partial [Planctomycetota bacterium]